MLDTALKYQEELQTLYIYAWHQDRYKYYNDGSYWNSLVLKEDTYNSHEFASVDADGDVIGFIAYDIDRTAATITNISIINFSNDIRTFAGDVRQTFRDIFEKYNFRKVSFSVVVGNPIEKTYDRLTLKYGGRIVGVQKHHVALFDNRIYDVKLYEILREDYLKAKEN